MRQGSPRKCRCWGWLRRGVIGISASVALAATVAPRVSVEAQSTKQNVRLEEIAALGSSSARLEASMLVSVAKFATGSYVVSPLFRPPTILLYASSDTSAWKDGRGSRLSTRFVSPPLLCIGKGDTLYAIDQRRVVRFDDALRQVDELSLDVLPRASTVVLSDGSFVVDGRVYGKGAVTYTVQMLNRAGTFVRSLAPEGSVGPAGATLVAAARNGGFWTLKSNESSLRMYNAEGVEMNVITIGSGDWFRPWEGIVVGEARNSRPRPHRAGLRQITDSLVAVLTWVADDGWRPAGTTVIAPATEDLSETWSTIVEIVKVGSGVVVASAKSRLALSFIAGSANEVVATRREGDGGVVVLLFAIDVEDV